MSRRPKSDGGSPMSVVRLGVLVAQAGWLAAVADRAALGGRLVGHAGTVRPAASQHRTDERNESDEQDQFAFQNAPQSCLPVVSSQAQYSVVPGAWFQSMNAPRFTGLALPSALPAGIESPL